MAAPSSKSSGFAELGGRLDVFLAGRIRLAANATKHPRSRKRTGGKRAGEDAKKDEVWKTTQPPASKIDESFPPRCLSAPLSKSSLHGNGPAALGCDLPSLLPRGEVDSSTNGSDDSTCDLPSLIPRGEVDSSADGSDDSTSDDGNIDVFGGQPTLTDDGWSNSSASECSSCGSSLASGVHVTPDVKYFAGISCLHPTSNCYSYQVHDYLKAAPKPSENHLD